MNNIFPLICAIQTRVCLISLCISLFAAICWFYQEKRIADLEDEIYHLTVEKKILEESYK